MTTDATTAYVQKIGKLIGLLEALQTAAENHFDTNPDDINWGHVGSLNAVVDRVQEAHDMALRQSEYAA